MGHKKSKLSNNQKVEKDYTSLTSNQIQYICRYTNLVDKEVRRRHEQFLNANNNGQLSREQFICSLQDIWPTGNVHRFANYLFNVSDKDQKGFLEFTEFIILLCQLNNESDYLGYLFDMFDVHQKGSLSREKIELLFKSLFELIGYPTGDQSSAEISQRQIAHLIKQVDESTSKCLSRVQFMNIGHTTWTDEDNGIGALLIEHAC